jgi:type VI secretion system protein ImpK
MNKQFGNVVHPVISTALELKDRLDKGESPEFETEQRKLLDLLRTDGETRRQLDYTGDGSVFLGARYALACWIDELFIVHSPWAKLWNERKLEVALYGTLDRAWKFWEQVDLALKRPNTPRPSVAPGPDAIETYYLCLALGFRGKFLNDPARVREYLEEIRPQVSKTGAWQPPRDLGVTTNVEPLTGGKSLRRVAWVYGSVSLLVLLALLILARFLLA